MSRTLSSIIAPRNRIQRDYVATEGQTLFSGILHPGQVDVYHNGVKLLRNTNYVADGLGVTLPEPMEN